MEKGEIKVIIGGSGCGKRVIVKNIISLVKTDKGMSCMRSEAQVQTILKIRNGVEVTVGPGDRFEDEDFKYLFGQHSEYLKIENA